MEEFIDKIVAAMDVHQLTLMTLSFLNAKEEGQDLASLQQAVMRELEELNVIKYSELSLFTFICTIVSKKLFIYFRVFTDSCSFRKPICGS